VNKRSLVEFKDEMLMGLYNVELKETCLFYMPKELQHENVIKAVPNHQLVNLRKYRAPSHFMAVFRSTYSFETLRNSTRSDEMLKTGQISMEVNTMSRLIVDKSEDESGEMSGDVNALQA